MCNAPFSQSRKVRSLKVKAKTMLCWTITNYQNKYKLACFLFLLFHKIKVYDGVNSTILVERCLLNISFKYCCLIKSPVNTKRLKINIRST